MKNHFLAISLCIAVLLFSCARNLKEDITLNIDDTGVNYNYGANDESNYLDVGDSNRLYNEVLREIGYAFREKGNDVTLTGIQGDYTLRIVSFYFTESQVSETVTDPCDTSTSLNYTVSTIEGFMKCEVINNFTGQNTFVEAEAESDEDVKNHPTIFQTLIGNDSCYTPRVSNAYPEAVERRLVRRIHRRAMQVIKGWQ
ncbi:MAG TPA: hypothetical protein VK826_16805 [Bacteroidia bacterium]|nr:hypothetical protein [Bacteroidia bacterium]